MLPSFFWMNNVPAMCCGKLAVVFGKYKPVLFVTPQSGDRERSFVRLAMDAGVARLKHRTDWKNVVLDVSQIFRLGPQRTTATSLGRTAKYMR
jgi:hypothetical protein